MFDKNKRTLDIRGKEEFKFDFQKEKSIYLYLWRLRALRRKDKKLEGKLKFDKYEDWKQYICNRYASYGEERLAEFSRFLNQKKRNLKPNQEYLNILIPVMVSLVVGETFKQVLETKIDFSGISIWVQLGVEILLALLLGIGIAFLVFR